MSKVKVVAGTSKLPENEFETNVKGKAKKAIDNPGPSYNPTAQDVMTKITDYGDKRIHRDGLIAQVKQETEDMNVLREEINGYMNDKWAGQLETFANGDKGVIKFYEFRVKGEDMPTSIYNITNTKPVMEILLKGLAHEISFKNSGTGEVGLLDDIKELRLYECFSDSEPPSDLTKWIYLGTVSRGKYTNHFTADQLGKTVWYIAVYIGKPSAQATSSELSSKLKRTVV